MRIHNALLALAALVPHTLLSQTPSPKGRIEARITDSVHARPAAGVTVYVTRVSPDPEFRAVEADEKGRVHVDSLPAGQYTIDFNIPFLDSLDLTLPSRAIVLAPDERVQVELATPSAPTLRAAACPGLQLPKGRGAVVGRVTDADTDKPLVGARVAVSWTDLAVDRATLRPVVQQRGGATPVDSLGRYRLCGVPTETYLLVQIQDKGRAGSAVRVSVADDVGLLKRDLSLSAGASRLIVELDSSATGTADSVPVARMNGTAVLTGTVRGESRQPLPDAQVSVLGAAGSAHTDSVGRFTLSSLPAGTQLLEIRRIGYLLGQLPVELRGGRGVEQEVTLSKIVSLDSIRVVARRGSYREYETRAKRSGRFLSQQDIEQRSPMQTSDIVRMLPGFRVVGSGLDTKIVSSRGAISFQKSTCETNVVIDGMQHQDINLLPPSDVGAMEVYSAASSPMEYDSVCGVIVVWTKR